MEKNINTLWNFFTNSKADESYFTHTTYTTHTTHTTHSTPLSTELQNLFKKIYDSNIIGRNLELFLPLFFIANIVSKQVLDTTLHLAKSMTLEKTHEQEIESLDVMLLDFISQQEEGLVYLQAKDLVRNFREFSDANPDEINTKWFGLALKRLKLYIDKKRKGNGVQYLLNIPKAKEKIKMFRSKKEDDPK